MMQRRLPRSWASLSCEARPRAPRPPSTEKRSMEARRPVANAPPTSSSASTTQPCSWSRSRRRTPGRRSTRRKTLATSRASRATCRHPPLRISRGPWRKACLERPSATSRNGLPGGTRRRSPPWNGRSFRKQRSIAATPRYRRDTALSPQESERTERIARLFVHARRALGTDAEARAFMRTAHAELDGRSPMDAANTDLGTRRTERLLTALEYGLAL